MRRRITPDVGRKMARVRWDRHHATRPEREPKYRRDPAGLSLGVRDDATGEVAWVPFKSLRDALRRLACVRTNYVTYIR